MKKVVKIAAVLIASGVAGILTWRKVESDRIRTDLWTEAERVTAEQDAAETQPAPAHRA